MGDAVHVLRRSMLSLMLVALATFSAMAQAPSPFPAPLPGEQTTSPLATFPTSPNASAPPFSSTAPWPDPPPAPDNPCVGEFRPLRAEAERRGQLLRAASERHAAPEEACRLMGEFIAAEVKMMKYVELKGSACGIPRNIMDQLNSGHKHSEDMRTRICTAAAATRKRWPEGTVTTDFGDPAFKDPSQLFKIGPEPRSQDRAPSLRY